MISLIAALDRRGAIGKDNAMPWHLPADLQWFRRTTRGRPVIMGRRTFESIGRALPGRRNVVVTRQPEWQAAGVETANCLQTALALVGDAPETFVIGGGQLYAQALPLADRLYLTLVDVLVDGADAFFPPVDGDSWREVERTDRPPDEQNPLALSWVRYERRA